MHTAEFRNRTFGQSRIAPIERIFNRVPVGVQGGNTQVSVAMRKLEQPFEVFHIASQRTIYDLGNLGSTPMIHSTGQSGHPVNRHYDDYTVRNAAISLLGEQRRRAGGQPEALLLKDGPYGIPEVNPLD